MSQCQVLFETCQYISLFDDHNSPFRLLGNSTERLSYLLNSPSREQKRRHLSPGDLGQSQPLCKISFLTYVHYLIGG